jgi:ABC-type uncharacterized transport system substrate-binding protein
VLALTTRSKLPAVYELRQFVAAGGLMSYDTNVPDVYRQIGVYAGRVLKGEKPGGSTGSGTHKVRYGYQFAHREGARH